LNFGHTFAHALESFTKYERFAHGEAVFVGLIAATWLSNKMGANLDLDKLLVQRNTFKLQVSDLLDHIDELTEAMMMASSPSSSKTGWMPSMKTLSKPLSV